MAGGGISGGGRREQPMVPRADFRSYYGRPIVKRPTWKMPDVPAYLFLGGTSGSAATLAAFADLTGRQELARAGRQLAAVGSVGSVAALIHDLGRPERFLNMLRIFKPTSPLSVGSWILAPFSALTTASAVSQATGILPWAGRAAGFGSAFLGPPMCTYTAVLLADTAVPSWHEAYPELPFVFAGSALTTGAGATALAVPAADHTPLHRMGLIGAGMELAASARMRRRLTTVGEPYREGTPGRLLRWGEALTAAGTGLWLGALALRRRGGAVASALGAAAYLAGGLCTRIGVFKAGMASVEDPKYVVLSQRERLAAQRRA